MREPQQVATTDVALSPPAQNAPYDSEFHIPGPRQATVSTLSLASGSIYSMHADFFNGWDQRRFAGMVGRLN